MSFKDHLWVFMEFMDGGNLAPMIDDLHGDYSEAFCKFSIYSVLKAVADLHRKNIVHCDIRSENVLVNRNGIVKLRGLEHGTALSPKPSRCDASSRSVSWMAPELMD